MKIKNIITEDFCNYKKPSMFIAMPYCSFKCEKENCDCKCQNSALANAPVFDIPKEKIVQQYLSNPITEAIVFGGLEPFDSFDELLDILNLFREVTQDDIVIYTGFMESELVDEVNELKHYGNIIIKFGRYIPNFESDEVDEVLGVKLASKNQYGKRI